VQALVRTFRAREGAMLILTRKSGETITVGDDVVVNVLEIKGSQVKIGIDAPLGICVHRGEIYEKIQQENMLAATVEAFDFDMAAKLCKPEKGQSNKPVGKAHEI
jgi:carbon storage regulator